jgi:hypothetical protein
MSTNTLIQDFLVIRRAMRENDVTKEVARALGQMALLEHLDSYKQGTVRFDKVLDGVLPETKEET